jgi:hypothetical protein
LYVYLPVPRPEELGVGLLALHSGLRATNHKRNSLVSHTTSKILAVSSEDLFVGIELLCRVVSTSSDKNNISAIWVEQQACNFECGAFGVVEMMMLFAGRLETDQVLFV